MFYRLCPSIAAICLTSLYHEHLDQFQQKSYYKGRKMIMCVKWSQSRALTIYVAP